MHFLPTLPSRLVVAGLFLAALVPIACDTTTTQPEQQVVVEGYLQAEAPMGTLRLSRTVGVDETYSPAQTAVRGAEVVVHRLTDRGEIAETIPYEAAPHPGMYEPVVQRRVQPKTSYRLEVTTSDGTELTATTTVPGPIEVVRTRNDTTVYPASGSSGSSRQPAVTIVPPSTASDSQNVFVFTTTSLLDFRGTPDSVLQKRLTPLYADVYDPEEDSLDVFRVRSSGLLNEGNYDRNSDGTITVRLPWLAVAFFGPNEIAVNVVDTNLYDFIRTQQAQQGGFSAQQPGLGPGEIPNVLDHVEGGAGVFGSYARVSRHIEVRPPSEGPSRGEAGSSP